MKNRSKYEKFHNSLKKRIRGVITLYNLFIFSPKKANEFQKYDNLKLYIDTEELFLNNINILNGKYLRYDVILNYMGIKGIKDKDNKYLKIIENFINIERLKKQIERSDDQQPLLISGDEKILKGEVFKLSMALYKKQTALYIKYDLQKKLKIIMILIG